MNITSESLLQAMTILNEKNNSKLKFDRTIQAIIKQVRNIPTGQYLVEYEGGEFTAYSQNLTHVYSVGDKVYIKIPGGDFSNKKFIEGYGEITNTQLSSSEKQKLEKYSPDLLKDLFVGTENSTIELIAGYNPNKNDDPQDERTKCFVYGDVSIDRLKNYYGDSIVDNIIQDSSTTHEMFKSYMNKYSNLLFTIDVETLFNFSASSGDYGMAITLWPSKKEEETNYPLPNTTLFHALEHFNGNIYRFNYPANQQYILEFSQGDYDGISIQFFENNFSFEKRNTLSYDREKEIANILFSNIEMYFVAKTGEIPYNVIIKKQIEHRSLDTEGKKQEQTIKLIPQLYYGNTKIDDKQIEWSWYTYKKDGISTSDYVGYNGLLGLDWIPTDLLNNEKIIVSKDEETGQVVLSIILNNFDTELVWKTKDFKAVAKYSEDNQHASPVERVNNPYLNLDFSIIGDGVSNPKTLTFSGQGTIGEIKYITDDFIPYWEFEENKEYNSRNSEEAQDNEYPYVWNIPNAVFSNYANRSFICSIYKKKVKALKEYYYTADGDPIYLPLWDLQAENLTNEVLAKFPSSIPKKEDQEYEDYVKALHDLRKNIYDEAYNKYFGSSGDPFNFYKTEEDLMSRLDYTFALTYDADSVGEMELPISGLDTFYYDNKGQLMNKEVYEKLDFSINFPTVLTEEDKNYNVSNIEVFWGENSKIELADGTNLSISDKMISKINFSGLYEEGKKFKIDFTIKDKYDAEEARDNYFTIRYKYRNKYRVQRHYINFLLNGNLGTNGTGWYAVIEGNNILTGNNTDINHCLDFNLEVYKDGKLSGDYTIDNIEIIGGNFPDRDENYTHKILDTTNCNVYAYKNENEAKTGLKINWEGYTRIPWDYFDLMVDAARNDYVLKGVVNDDDWELNAYSKVSKTLAQMTGNIGNKKILILSEEGKKSLPTLYNYAIEFNNQRLYSRQQWRSIFIPEQKKPSETKTEWDKFLDLVYNQEENLLVRDELKKVPLEVISDNEIEQIESLKQYKDKMISCLEDIYEILKLEAENQKAFAQQWEATITEAKKISYKYTLDKYKTDLDTIYEKYQNAAGTDDENTNYDIVPVYFKLNIKTQDGYSIIVYHPIVATMITSNYTIPVFNLPKTIMYDTNGYNTADAWSSSTILKLNGNTSSENKPMMEMLEIDAQKPTFIPDYIWPDLKETQRKKIGSINWSAKEEEIEGNKKLIYSNYTYTIPDFYNNSDDRVFDIVRLDDGTNNFYHTIIYYLNRYGNDTINGWDGQKLIIKSTENGDDETVILAPTIGAGRKNEDNSFSGVVMGVDPLQDLTGIYGYKRGERTFALQEDGNAYFKGDVVARSLTLGSDTASKAGLATKEELDNTNSAIGNTNQNLNQQKIDLEQQIDAAIIQSAIAGQNIYPNGAPEQTSQSYGTYGQYCLYDIYNTVKTYVGRTVTISFDLELNSTPQEGQAITVRPWYNQTAGPVGTSIADTFTITDFSKERYIFTTTIQKHTEASSGKIDIFTPNKAPKLSFSISKFKIEFGNSSNGWTEYAGDAWDDKIEELRGEINALDLKLGAQIEAIDLGDDYVKLNFTYNKDGKVEGDQVDTEEDITRATQTFFLSKDGLLKGSNAIIYGTVYAGAGKIGNWSITNGNLENNLGVNPTIKLSPDGDIRLRDWYIKDTTYKNYTATEFVSAQKTIGSYKYETVVKASNTDTTNEFNGVFAVRRYNSNGTFKDCPFLARSNGHVTAKTLKIENLEITDKKYITITDPDNTDSYFYINAGYYSGLGTGSWSLESNGNLALQVPKGYGFRINLDGTNMNSYGEILKGAFDGSDGVYLVDLWGTWRLRGSPIATTSDYNQKNNIKIFDDKYDKFFDDLQPITFKYKVNNSNRTHSGFIAQWVAEGLEKNNLTTQDFAGVVISHRGKEDEEWYLRYEEFIALNTWQIQKAKARISELETRVSQLESLLQANLD